MSVKNVGEMFLEGSKITKQKIQNIVSSACLPPLRLNADLWTSKITKLKYLGETVGSTLPVRLHKSKHAFINELEEITDAELGPYEETALDKGGQQSNAQT